MFRQVIASFRPICLPLGEAIKKLPRTSASLAVQIPFYLPNPLDARSLPTLTVINPRGDTVRKSRALGSMLLVGGALTTTVLYANQAVASAEAKQSSDPASYIHVILDEWKRRLSLTIKEPSTSEAIEEIAHNFIESLRQWEPFLERSHVNNLCTIQELFTALRPRASKSITAVEQKIGDLIYKLDPDPRPLNTGGLTISGYSAAYIDSVLERWTDSQTLEEMMKKQWRWSRSVVWKDRTQAIQYIMECLEEWKDSLEPSHIKKLSSLQEFFKPNFEEENENSGLYLYLRNVIDRLNTTPENLRPPSADSVLINEVLSRLLCAPESATAFKTLEEMMALQLKRSGSPIWNDIKATIEYVETWINKWERSTLEESHIQKLNELQNLFRNFRSSSRYRRQLHNEPLKAIDQAFQLRIDREG